MELLDGTLMRCARTPKILGAGFPGETMHVLPRPRVREALTQPGTSHLLVTDCGHFPEARGHGRVRTSPIADAVVLVCTRGSGWCTTAAGTFAVTAGQIVLLPPGEPHGYGSDAADPWTLWWLHLAGSDLPEFLQAARATVDAPVRTLSDVYAAVALISAAITHLGCDSTTNSLLAASGAAWHLLAILASDRPPGDARSTALDRAAQFLHDHPAERIEVAELASMACLSPSHFAALFRRRFGMPVLQYRTELRMARARELLDMTERPIAEVAAAAGYEDSFYFARQFKRIHGLTPHAYRTRN
ncbi:AraC family transcriptional regulator [Rathayibacter sp. PhB151]|uniref:AraC family transcriptional regulator n=1 Tax=Rathayibacter sp. PhB151 TaxID=2485189 RepID=UPI0010EB7F23|nr:AraC family transcriptional regulator [Rathayibacter sp. PhB151]TDX77310.1 AraC family transcriptional regulator [Rathayibacter sp. PhB151]